MSIYAIKVGLEKRVTPPASALVYDSDAFRQFITSRALLSMNATPHISLDNNHIGEKT